MLDFQRSADVLVMLILGGAGRLYGGLIGAIIFMVARDQFSGINPQYWYFWIGLLLVVVVLFLPNGILGGLAQLVASERWQRWTGPASCRWRNAMTAPALSTRGLNKSFGSLVVASDIEIDAAARRALRADRPERRRQDHADQPDDRHAAARRRPDHARRRRHHRAAIRRSGCSAGSSAPSRSTRCFRTSIALEAVTLAICERAGRRRAPGGKPVTAYRDAVDEAYAILKSLMLGHVCYRPTRELAYGQQRLLEIALALATRPKVLLLDEPAAGVPREESAELFAAVTNLSQDITVLFIEHDMNVVFRFASRIIVMVGGRSWSKARRRRFPPIRACARSISAERIMAEPLLALKDVRAGYGDAVVLDDISFELAEARQPRGARAQRRRQDDAAADHHGLHQRQPRHRSIWRGRDITRLAPHQRRARAASAGWRRSARFSRRSRSRRT